MEVDANSVLNAAVLVLASVGVAHLVHSVIRCGLELYRLFLRGPHNLPKRYGGKWAVVTGATDGIGRATAVELAKRGLSVLLVSRSQSKLDETKEDISKEYPMVSVKTCSVDFTKFDSAEQEAMNETLKQLESDGGLAILVNNVGIAYEYPAFFHELGEDRVQSLVKLNIDSTNNMTRLALPIMKERTGGKRRGSIINIGSSSGLFPMPLLSEYSATKAYIQRLTEGLAVEYAPLGVDFQVHTPFYIVSKLSKFKKPSAMVPSAREYAKLLCDRIGYETVVNPHMVHALTEFALRMAPSQPRSSYLYSMHQAIRKKALAKQKRDEDKKQ